MKKFLALTLAGVMTVGLLAGCGGGTASTPAPAASAAPAAESKAPVDSGNSGSTATGAFKIGASGPLTGEAAIYGNAVMNEGNIMEFYRG